jgi:hypothetical protein
MKRSTIENIEHHCYEEYILTGQPLSVVELAKASKRSEQAVRDACRESTRLDYTTKSKNIMSKDYPHMVHQTREVGAYWPSRKWLVDSIRHSRRVLEHKVQYGH